LQPADVRLNQVIKHCLKQSQMQYLVEAHQQQITDGLTSEQVKFSVSLPVLCDASVAGLVEVYDFMMGPTGHQLVKKFNLLFFMYLVILLTYSSFRLGNDALLKSGIFQPSMVAELCQA
jgi:UDP-N-acetylglucosamine transferase subunit ALG13